MLEPGFLRVENATAFCAVGAKQVTGEVATRGRRTSGKKRSDKARRSNARASASSPKQSRVKQEEHMPLGTVKKKLFGVCVNVKPMESQEGADIVLQLDEMRV